MWENLSREFLIFYHSFTHSSSHHYYASSLWDSEWEKSTGSIRQWIGCQAELKTPYCHQCLYQKVMKCSTSHCIMKNRTKFMHLLPHIEEKTTTNSTTDGPLIANQRKNPETYFCFSQCIYDLECFIFYICSNTGMHLKFYLATQEYLVE